MTKKNKNNENKQSPPYSLKKLLNAPKKPKNSSRQNYTSDNFARALNDIKNDVYSRRKASKIYDIPYSTLTDAINGNVKSHKLGIQPVLGIEIESILCEILLRLSDAGVGLSKFEIFSVVQNYLNKNNIKNSDDSLMFPDNNPTDRWYEGFLKRNPILTTRIAQSLAKCRAASYTIEVAEEWYNSVAKLYNEL